MSQVFQHLRLALFVAAAAALLGGAVLFLEGRRVLGAGEVYSLRVRGSVSGLEEGSPVTVNGVKVGVVSRIELVPEDISQVEVTLAFRHRLPLRRDASALVQRQGLSGPVSIEIYPGSTAQPLLGPGERVPAGVADLDRWTLRFGELAAGGAAVTAQLERLGSRENAEAMEAASQSRTRLAVRLAQLTNNATAVSDENRAALRGTADELRRARGSLSKAGRELAAVGSSEELREEVRATAEAARAATAAFEELAPRARAVLSDGRAMVEESKAAAPPDRRRELAAATLETLDTISALARDLQALRERLEPDVAATSDSISRARSHLDDFSETVRANPTSLLGASGTPETNP